MAGARRPVFAEILKTSWSITLKEVRKRRVFKKKKKGKIKPLLTGFQKGGWEKMLLTFE